MNLRKYVATVLDATEAEEVQIEVHIDENMNVDPLSPNLIRFNAHRQPLHADAESKRGKITPPPIEPESIVNDLKGEKINKRYQPIHKPPRQKPDETPIRGKAK